MGWGVGVGGGGWGGLEMASNRCAPATESKRTGCGLGIGAGVEEDRHSAILNSRPTVYQGKDAAGCYTCHFHRTAEGCSNLMRSDTSFLNVSE